MPRNIPTNITVRRLGPEDSRDPCFMIRRKVFIEEQGVSEEEEMDGLDDQADQYLLYVNAAPAATARIRYPDPERGKIERVAVLPRYRNLGVGEKLVIRLMADISTRNTVKEIILAALTSVVGFYEKLGFTAFGEEFLDAGIPHLWMSRKL